MKPKRAKNTATRAPLALVRQIDPREEKDLHLSLRQISLLVGKDRRHVVRRLTDAHMPHTTYRRGHPVWHLGRVWAAFKQPEVMRDEDLDNMHPLDRLAWLRGETLRQQLEAEAGDYLTAEDFAAEKARRDGLINACLDRIPAELAAHCGCTPEQAEVVRRHLEKARSALEHRLHPKST